MKVLLKVSTFTTETIVEINKVKYRVTTKGGLCPETNKKSRAITFDFVRVDKSKLTEKEEKIGDEIFESIINHLIHVKFRVKISAKIPLKSGPFLRKKNQSRDRKN